MRNSEKAKCPPDKHFGWHVAFVEFFSFLDSHTVRGGVSEQVLGFEDTDHKSDPASLEGFRSPHDLYVHKLRQRGFAVRTLKLDMNDWISAPHRARMYIVFVDASLGGEEAADWIEAASKDDLSSKLSEFSTDPWQHGLVRGCYPRE